MANEQNLKPFTSAQNREKAKINGRKGGIASGIAKRERKTLKELLQMELSELTTFKENGEIKEATKAVRAVKALIQKAFTGDVNAFNSIRDLNGEKPVEQVQNIEPVKIIDDLEVKKPKKSKK